MVERRKEKEAAERHGAVRRRHLVYRLRFSACQFISCHPPVQSECPIVDPAAQSGRRPHRRYLVDTFFPRA